MTRLWLLMVKELRGFLISPTFWLFVSLAWFIVGLRFRNQIVPSAPGGDVSVMLSQLAILVLQVQIIFVPLLTMRMIAEEKRSGTFEMLVTAPVRDHEVVLSKFLAAFLMNCMTWLIIPGYLFTLKMLNVDPDFGVVWTSYLGIVLVGGVFVAGGILASAATQHQVLAGFFAVVLISMLFFLPGLTAGLEGDFGRTINAAVSVGNLQYQLAESSVGLLDLRNLTYELCLMSLLLLFATRIVEIRKWR